MRPVALLVAVLALAPFISVTAQQRLPSKPGDRVRITAPTLDLDRYYGTFVAVRADSLVVRRDPNTWGVPIAAITRIEVRRGKPGPDPKELKIEGDWEEAVKKALEKKRPKEGWPEGEEPPDTSEEPPDTSKE